MSIHDESGADEGARVADTGVLRVRVDEQGIVAVLTLVGELDLASTEELSACFATAMGNGKDVHGHPRRVDERQARHIDDQRHAAEQRGSSLTLRGVQRAVLRTLSLAGLDKVLRIEP